ncbi:hypothetical protein AVEN_10782-1 [Araneus ventricosus]|uniref:Uncharacterized protein n=1 Tax=Araneus ventricosus TaxID=182803 RepID=A0A4Y2DD88_ARAVE|nr:hypothetical protein AVEN_10782-1 [Araneus ventricosus]
MYPIAESIKLEHLERKHADFSDGSESKLEENSTRREKYEYKQREDRAFSTIYHGVEEQHKTLIYSLKSAAEAWTVLKDQFLNCSV